MSMYEKVEYTPSQDKRFDISTDPFSTERISATYRAAKKVMVEHPFVAGVILFGSLSKGKVLTEKSAHRTDIDIALYFDSSKIHDVNNGIPVDSEEYKEVWEFNAEITSNKHNPKALQREVAEMYVDGVFEQTLRAGLSPENEILANSGVHTYKTSKSGRSSITGELHFLCGGGFFPEHYNEWIVSLGEQIRNSGNTEEAAGHYSPIALPWGLDMGGGMKKYRRAYFEQAAQLDSEIREAQWAAINESVRFFERLRNIPANLERYFPATHDEAVRYYSPRLVR